jgi:hypothetical protein
MSISDQTNSIHSSWMTVRKTASKQDKRDFDSLIILICWCFARAFQNQRGQFSVPELIDQIMAELEYVASGWTRRWEHLRESSPLVCFWLRLVVV